MDIERRLVRNGSLEKLFEVLRANGKSVAGPSERNGKTSFRQAEKYSDLA